MKRLLYHLLFFCAIIPAHGQLKFVIEDFEGFSNGTSDLKANGVFTFGSVKVAIERNDPANHIYLGDRFLKLEKEGKAEFGGWGKGVGLNVELNPAQDYLNFYVAFPTRTTIGGGNATAIKIELQEDDNGDNVYENKMDDSWTVIQKFDQNSKKENWQLISIPLNKFSDANPGGDGALNAGYKNGKLLCIIFSFVDVKAAAPTIFFDFLCFSKGVLPTDPNSLDPAQASSIDHCNLGAWSKEGNAANFLDIATNFEKIFKAGSEKKLGVVHLFQPFAVDGGNMQNFYPSVERLNKIVLEGYVPMITLEDHFVNAKPGMKQPNLYSIVEGHFDSFFAAWAKEVKQVNGTVLLRILHEFNGDWYPWCIANNNNDSQLFIRAFRRIHNIFRDEHVTNVKFIWCPNSMSLPQEKWNYIMDAYPGDEYVDYLGLDVYNGAGKGVPIWRSFRKEGIENYFLLTQQLPSKPLFICETASRERKDGETSTGQDKAAWIRQMSEALKSDMSKVRLLAWFNEKETFKINSSYEAQNAYLNCVLKNDYFKSGAKYIEPLARSHQ